jgi:hypothetical protein
VGHIQLTNAKAVQLNAGCLNELLRANACNAAEKNDPVPMAGSRKRTGALSIAA